MAYYWNGTWESYEMGLNVSILIAMRVGTLGLMIHDLAFGGANDTGKLPYRKKHASILVLSNAIGVLHVAPLSAEKVFHATQPVLTMFPSHGAGTLHKPRVSVVFAIPGFKVKKHYLTHYTLLQRVRDAPFLDQSFEYIPHHIKLVISPIHLHSPMMVMLQQKEPEGSALPYTGRMLRSCPCTADQAPGSLPVCGGARSKTRLKLIGCTVSWKMEPSRINRPHHILSDGDTWQSEK